MATASYDRTVITHGNLDALLFEWTITDTNDVGAPLPASEVLHSEVCWHVKGNFDTTGVLEIQGSNEEAGTTDGDYVAMKDASGSALSFSAAGIKTQLDHPIWSRPKATTSPVNISLTVRAFVFRKREPR